MNTPRRRWVPIYALPCGLRHLKDDNAAQRYMGSTAISILRCDALNQFRRTYWAPDRGSRLQELTSQDDKELFDDIQSRG